MLEDFRLQTFLAVADEGSFTRAAYLMGITQPAVSQHVAELEKAVGAPLFVRGRGSVRLTPEGERFRICARRILSAYAALDTVFSAPGEAAVTLSATPYLQQRFVPAFMERVRDRIRIRFEVRTCGEETVPEGEEDLRFHTAPFSGSLSLLDPVLGTVEPAAAGAEGLSADSAPLALWTPYRTLGGPGLTGRAVLVSDDPSLLLSAVRRDSGLVAVVPSDTIPSDIPVLPFHAPSLVLGIRCRMKEEFASTALGELFKDILSV